MKATRSLNAPLRPVGLGWMLAAPVRVSNVVGELWFHAGTSTQVYTSVDMAVQPRSGTVGPQWHVSIVNRSSGHPSRPSDEQVALGRCAFGLLTAEEDNHHPGDARHFWLPIDPSERVDCECKTDEVVVTDADGYQWTNPADGACRGCEFARVAAATGRDRPCPIHGGAEQRP